MLSLLDLFSGIGGFSLGMEATKRINTVAFCEKDEYCRKVLKKHWSNTQQYIDIRDIDGTKISADIISGGFPCQPFSVAGRQKGADDSRNMFPQLIEIAKIVRPRILFLENVPTLLNCGYFPTVLSSLSEAGYDARWVCLGADDVGARHRRKRLWLRCELADSNSKPRRQG